MRMRKKNTRSTKSHTINIDEIILNMIDTVNYMCLPHIASTCPFQYNFEAVDLWMVEHFVCVQRAHCLTVPLWPHEILTVPSAACNANERKKN